MLENNYLQKIVEKINETESSEFSAKGIYTYINPYSYLQLRKNQNLVQKFTKIYCDGILMVIFLKIIGVSVKRKSFDSTSMALPVISESAKNGGKLFLIGGVRGVAEKAAKYFSEKIPGVNICGIRDGYFVSEKDYLYFIDVVLKINPDLLIVGMGAPRQESLLVDLNSRGWNGLGYTCGGYFHQTASSGINYYPAWIDKLNMRWAYRIFDEPKLISRYTIDYGKFIFIFIFDCMIYKLATMQAVREK